MVYQLVQLMNMKIEIVKNLHYKKLISKKIEGTQEREYYNKDYMDFKVFQQEIHYNRML